jgi:hypothetical protein
MVRFITKLYGNIISQTLFKTETIKELKMWAMWVKKKEGKNLEKKKKKTDKVFKKKRKELVEQFFLFSLQLSLLNTTILELLLLNRSC